MNLFKKILFHFLFPISIWAALNLPEPAELLAKARIDRSALREVILDLEFNIPEFRDPATFNKYFFILDELDSLSNSSGLEEYYPLIVQKLGLNMVSNGLRWLDVTQDSPEKLSYYIKWMDKDTLARFQGMIEYQLSTMREHTKLMTMSQTLSTLLPQIDEKAASTPYIQYGFRRLISDAAVALLKNELTTEEQIPGLIAKLIISSSLAEYLNYLNQDILKLNEEDKVKGHLYISKLDLLYKQFEKLSDNSPLWLINEIGDSFCQVLILMVHYEEVVSANEMALILKSLNLRRVQALAQQWMAEEHNFSPDYMDTYINLSSQLQLHLQTVGLQKESEDFSKWLSLKAAPIVAQKLNVEGFYQLTNDKGEVWYFTLAFAKKDYLIASLVDAKGFIFKNFYNVAYSVEGSYFVASDREQNTDNYQNPPIKFWLKKNGEIKIFDLYVRGASPVLKGHKIQSFINPSKYVHKNAPSADGFYEGELFFSDGKSMHVRLIVTLFEGYSIGRIDSKAFTLDLNIGSKGTDGTLLLTSGRSQGSWLQIRARVTKEGLETHVILGKLGQSKTVSFLKRTN